jgi:Winged helix-turn helix
VKLLFHQYREKKDLLFEDHQKGKKNHAYSKLEEEVAFLAPFIATAEKAGILIAADVHRALKKKLGKTNLSIQTTYNLLHRHNWRKIAPRPYHPKRDSVARELWKTECRTNS